MRDATKKPDVGKNYFQPFALMMLVLLPLAKLTDLAHTKKRIVLLHSKQTLLSANALIVFLSVELAKWSPTIVPRTTEPDKSQPPTILAKLSTAMIDKKNVSLTTTNASQSLPSPSVFPLVPLVVSQPPLSLQL